MTKNYVCSGPYLRNHISYDCHLWNTCKMIISPGIYFIFLKKLIFWVVQRVKGQGQKIAQNGKRFCLLHLIFLESYIIWSSLMVHMCKRIIYPSIFFIFKKFWFSGSLGGGKSTKNTPKCWKFCLSHSVPQAPCIIWL